ncbi:penicillin-binding protein 1A [Ideonella livida]|uniref:Penicillin-binding protein 1A n=1 Tax=Ideonella livida TaxID=2707176 RepID=A0A7C9PIM6_9BURK|nr:PBP1A family penicillin-binding protein [Ideonella livida]NDY92957.1 PBP1A family penicillin-binding protein [Ideonella livida]
MTDDRPPLLSRLRARLAAQPWLWPVVVLGAAGGAGLLLVLLAALVYFPQLPALDRVTDYQPRLPLQVFTRDGVEIAQFGSERRQYLPIAQIPRRMQDAIVTVEDIRFREHSGLDFRGIARAVFNVFTRGRVEGASTITQQVARNFFLSARRTPERKIKEALLALKIEGQLSKDEILELYMNQIYLGQRAYGFGAAAQVYFGKPLAELSIAECAMLAGLPKNPAFANPITNFARASARQQVILARLHETGTISDTEYAAAKAEKLVIRTKLQTTVHAEYVAEMARKAVYDQFGEAAYTSGIKVYTSLVAADQQAAWAALRRGVLDHERKQPWRGPEAQEDLPDDDSADTVAAQILKEHRDDEDLRVALVLKASPKSITAQLASGETITVGGDGLRLAQPGLVAKPTAELSVHRGSVIRVVRHERQGWQVAQWPQAQGALVSLDSGTGRVRALVGGFDFTRQQFNHVTQAWRQPGSSFKPFLYSAALEHGVMPQTLINDAPLVLPGAGGPGDWNPQNSDGEFDGPISLRRALAKSKNLVSIRLVQQMGVGPSREWVGHFGFEAAKHPDNLTLALGAGSVTPLQLASAYAVLANGGYKVSPLVIERIVDGEGKTVFEAPPAPALSEDLRVVPARNVFITNSLLNEVTRSGTAARAQAQLGRPDLYGKTGTTNDAVDAWFAGFQPGIVAVVWMGYDEPRSLGSRESGGGLSLPVWISYMERALRGVPVAPQVPPEGVVEAGGDWRYAEYAEGGWLTGVGLEEPGAAEAAASAAAGASATGPAPVAASAPATPALPVTPVPPPALPPAPASAP